MVRRSLDERVAKSEADELRVIALALSALRVEARASRVYINEIVESIENGLLLSAIVLATILLEIWIRDLLVIRMVTQRESKGKRELQTLLTEIDRETEGASRGESFASICRKLLSLDVIQQDEHDRIQEIYKNFRIPLLHGTTGRIVDRECWGAGLCENTYTGADMAIKAIFGGAPHRRANDLEDLVFSSAVNILGDIVNFIAAHKIPKIGR
ncbi:MAG: hypothetical protein M0Z85_12735 [Gammaproteobacteria bacterium]|nr:hypothetical protein [Gammaproteobacteria bacterium]